MILFILLFAGPGLTYALLRSSKVQTYLVQRVAGYLSKELDTRVEVGGLDISFFLNIVLKDVVIDDREGNPMVQTQRMVFDIGRVSFRHKYLSINKLMLDKTFLGLSKYPDRETFNFSFFIDYFSNDATERDSAANKWDVVCKSLEFRESSFKYQVEGMVPASHGFDKNYFEVHDLNFVMIDIFLDEKLLSFHLDFLSLKMPGGHDLDYLTGSFRIGPDNAEASRVILLTPRSDLAFDLSLSYPGYEAFSSMYDNIDFTLLLKDSEIDLHDLGFFIPPLFGIDGQTTIVGRLSGKPSNIIGEKIYLTYGSQTRFEGDFQLRGFPAMDNFYLDFFVEDFNTSVTDIAGFRLPMTAGTEYIIFPEYVFNLGQIAYRGRVSGFLSSLSAKGNFKTDLGNFTTDLGIQKLPGKSPRSYKGKINTRGFDLGRLFNATNKLGLVQLDAMIVGVGVSLQTLDVILNGKISSLDYSGYRYQQIDVSGEVKNRMFNGALSVDDPNLLLNFLGVINFAETLPEYNFSATVDHANLSALNLYQRVEDAESVMSFTVNILATGASVDDIDGQIDICDIVYEERASDMTGEPVSTFYRTGNISLININEPGRRQILSLHSDFADIFLTGMVRYSQIGAHLRQFAAKYIPAFFQHGDKVPISTGNYHAVYKQEPQQMLLEIQCKDTEMLSALFLPSVKMTSGSTFSMNFDSDKHMLDIHGNADTLTLFGNRLPDWNMLGSLVAAGYQFTTQSSQLMISDDLIVDNFCFDGLFYHDTIFFEANWKSFDPDLKRHGHIEGITRFYGDKHAELSFTPSYAMLDGSRWQLNLENEIFFDKERIEVRNLVFFNEGQSLRADGILSNVPGDRMQVIFSNFDYANIDFLLFIPNMDFGGIINGSAAFTAFYQQPVFEAALHFSNFSFNHVLLGKLSAFSTWDESVQAFKIDGELFENPMDERTRMLRVSGQFLPGEERENFDLTFAANRLPLAIWERYLRVFADNVRGYASGDIYLKGPAANPWIEGRVVADQAGFHVDYLNTRYAFAHRVDIGKNFFRFDNLVLLDSLRNTGIASGTIWHENFRDFRLDLMIRLERMLVLNTNASHNELYYGKAFGSGLLHIHGPEDNIIMDVSARTNRGTQIFLPLVFGGEVMETNFITFVSRDTTLAQLAFPVPSVSGVTLNFELEVTPDAELQLIFDSQIGDIIRGRGSGNLKLEITSQGAFNMYGEYIIQEGDYLFTLQNLFNKRFRIEQGGLIRWTGDPNDADVDLRAAYRLRTSLYDLMMSVDTSDVYRRRVPVECMLILEDKLFNPNISFDIVLPGGDEAMRELIERRITTEQEMNRQVFSLLVLNRFMPATTDQYNTALGYGVGSTSSELLSNQLSNWLSQISSEFDIGVNYRPGDQISSQELELALSTQLFDDRVLIDGNLGVAGNNPAQNQRTSNIIGDVNVEVKITPEGKFRIKAFNRSNTFDIINTNSPYTQGVGIFYRKEFDNLSELFRRSVRPSEIPSYEEENSPIDRD